MRGHIPEGSGVERDGLTDPVTPQLPSPAELLVSLPLGIFIHDPDGHILQANHEFADLLGYPVPELLGLDIDTLVQHDHLTQIPPAPGGSSTELNLVHRDGRSVVLRAKSSRLQGELGLTLVCVEDWTTEHQRIAELTWAAYHDGLTGLVNRAGLIQHLERLRSEQREASVALIDLNGFKSINDNHGHSGGDDYLRAVAQRLTAAVPALTEKAPAFCTVARLAGDEFVVVWSEVSSGGQNYSAEPVHLEQLIRRALLEPISIRDSVSGQQVSLVVSAAVGAVARQDWMDPEQVLDWADRLMYAEKRQMRENRHS